MSNSWRHQTLNKELRWIVSETLKKKIDNNQYIKRISLLCLFQIYKFIKLNGCLSKAMSEFAWLPKKGKNIFQKSSHFHENGIKRIQTSHCRGFKLFCAEIWHCVFFCRKRDHRYVFICYFQTVYVHEL